MTTMKVAMPTTTRSMIPAGKTKPSLSAQASVATPRKGRRRLKKILLTIGVILLVLAIAIPATILFSLWLLTVPQPVTAQSAPLGPLMVVPADAPLTPTPFQPLAPTPVYIPTDFPAPVVTETSPDGLVPASTTEAVAKSWNDYPGPTIWPDIEVPPPMGLLAQPEGQVNILLLGSDQRPDDGGFRTDTILLLTLNPKGGTASITSFPRDLYVYIPGYTVQRINTAFAFGGFESLALTMEYNFGVRPDRYMVINLWSFKDLVDNLGGIDVDVAQTLTDQRDGYGDYTLYPGQTHMDGETTLWYVRARYTTSDFDRGRRQQEVLEALFHRLMNLDALSRAADLYNIYLENVVTNISFNDILAMLPLATQIASDTSRIHRHAISPAQVYDWINYSGSMVLVPVRESVLEVMRQALNSPAP